MFDSKQAKSLVASVSTLARRSPKRLRRLGNTVGHVMGRAKSKTARLVAKNPLRAILAASAAVFVLAKLRRNA